MPHHNAPTDHDTAAGRGTDAAAGHGAGDPELAAMLAAISGAGGEFRHRQHVNLAFLAVRRYGMPEATGRVCSLIRRIAAYERAPQKYHHTVSRAWVELVAHHVAADPECADFEVFARRNPALLDKRLLSRHYRSVTLAAGAARRGWVEPDLLPFQPLQPGRSAPDTLTPSAAHGGRRHQIMPAEGVNREDGTRESPRAHLPGVVARLGETQYPDAYGGLTARLTGPDESRAIKMTIYVVAARAGPFLAAVRGQSARSPGAQYTIVHVPHTWAELNILAQTIEDAKDQWRARGVHLSAADPDAPASKVIVSLLAYSTAAANALTATYGRDWISVVPSSARYIPL